MDTLEKLEHFDQYYTQVDYDLATDACGDLDAECHCAHSVYWAEREEFDCSDYPLVYWYHPDYLGNTEYITDMNGEAFQYFWYSPWGESWVEEHSGSGSYESPYRFNAKELDGETGLYYYGARYRDPRAIPWLSVDPLAKKFPEWNPYNFCLNNPILFVDPDGRAPDITIRGKNNSSVTVKTELIDVSVDASSLGIDFGGNYSLSGADFVITAVDIVGVIDPTPASDILGATLSADQGGLLGCRCKYYRRKHTLRGRLSQRAKNYKRRK